MKNHLNEYFFIFIFLILSLIIAIILTNLSNFLILQKINDEKNSSYECGFSPFGDARNKIDIKFYLIGILFLIFDIEIVFIFPWTLIASKMKLINIYIIFFFILILMIGLIYELWSEALDWK